MHPSMTPCCGQHTPTLLRRLRLGVGSPVGAEPFQGRCKMRVMLTVVAVAVALAAMVVSGAGQWSLMMLGVIRPD